MGESRVRKNQIVEQVAGILEVSSEHTDQLPQVVAQMRKALSTRPIVVTIVVDPSRRILLQVGTSQIPASVEVYQLLATTLTTLAQQFNNTAAEVAKNVGKPERMGEDGPSHGSLQSRDGSGPDQTGEGVVS